MVIRKQNLLFQETNKIISPLPLSSLFEYSLSLSSEIASLIAKSSRFPVSIHRSTREEEETPSGEVSISLSMASESDKWELKLRAKLVLLESVEVLSLEEGLQGSWHSGMVIDMKLHQRTVMYKHLFETDQPQSPNLVEFVPVSSAIDGMLRAKPLSQPLNPKSHSHLNEHLLSFQSHQTSKRNNIRPYACRLPLQPSQATYGMCVDACIENVHWEGIIIDDINDHTAQIMQINVFFPDMGIEEPVLLQDLSLSSDWDEVTGEWTLRGRWKFLEALEANQLERGTLGMTAQQLWHMARSEPSFITKHCAWTCGSWNEWFSLVLSLKYQLPHLTTSPSVQSSTFLRSVSDFVEAYKDRSSSQADILTKSLKQKSDIARSHLKSLGWKFMETRRGTKYYVSTDGTRYDSFIKACEGYLSGKAEHSHYENATCSVVPGVISDTKATRGQCSQRGTWNKVSLIPEYSSVLGRGAKYGDVDMDTVRKHLLHLGWSVEYKRDTSRPMTRFRYHSPEGKTYYSLRMVFADFVSGFHLSGPNGHDSNAEMPEERREDPVLTEGALIDNILPEHLEEQAKLIAFMQASYGKLEVNIQTGENQPIPNGCSELLLRSTGNKGYQLELYEEGSCFTRALLSNDIKGEYQPESIKIYIECIENRISCNLKGFTSPSDVKSSARGHLLSAGWTQCMMYLKSKRSRMVYRSPSGKYFYSLLQACKAYLVEAFPKCGDAATIMHERNISEETSGSSPSVLMERSSSPMKTHHTFYSQSGELASQRGKSKKRKCRDAANLINEREMLSKSKGNPSSYHVTESNSPRSPLAHAKTVLSLLLDKNLVMPRTRVSYRYGHFYKDGVITCNGIRCICCNKSFSATNFELHAGGASSGKPLMNIYLRDGRSLLQCLVEAMEIGKLGMQFGTCLKAREDHKSARDVICSACHHGGFLVECCNCPSAFHPSCVDLKRTPECYWCPLCCCRVCGSGTYTQNSNDLCDKAVVVRCQQCNGRFHVGCIIDGCSGLDCGLTKPWFCSSQCCEVSRMLESLVGKKIPTLDEGLTWSILKYSKLAQDHTAILEPELMAEQLSKLCLAAEVLNECFMPMIESHTNSDLISDIIFNRESNLCRINYKGFYTIIMEKGEEVVAVATLRVHGGKIAELPLLCTRPRYRRQGMCRSLITELEQLLRTLRIENLILPSIPHHLRTWRDSFNFNIIEEEQLLSLVMHNVLTFPGSRLLGKKVCSI
ncbi:hypothetical protein LUZ63_007523 [Rhynchospora breviuscula]|uniref:N-acetyltransferase domain-containing protein n=1 Tax=Rhynchospora breviuscula TaxID=2022672 RepID=A0A9Q0HUM5_9POAL|nr:hypothetical protein LUZ63_007523 [Rhynchospora breviuscula]